MQKNLSSGAAIRLLQKQEPMITDFDENLASRLIEHIIIEKGENYGVF